MSKKERETYEFEMNFKKIFIVAVLSNDDIISSRPCLKTGPGLKTGVKSDIFWSEIGSVFGEPGSIPQPRIPRSIPPEQYNNTGGNSYSVAFI